MIWQDIVLAAIGGGALHALYVRDVARRRRGQTIRQAVLPKRRRTDEPPNVTEVV